MSRLCPHPPTAAALLLSFVIDHDLYANLGRPSRAPLKVGRLAEWLRRETRNGNTTSCIPPASSHTIFVRRFKSCSGREYFSFCRSGVVLFVLRSGCMAVDGRSPSLSLPPTGGALGGPARDRRRRPSAAARSPLICSRLSISREANLLPRSTEEGPNHKLSFHSQLRGGLRLHRSPPEPCRAGQWPLRLREALRTASGASVLGRCGVEGER